MRSELSVDEMIVATINSSKSLDECVRKMMVAWIKCAVSFENEVDDLAEWNRNLEKEKCELLGVVQQKDKLINKMKCCDNCKHRLKVLEMEILDLDKDELREPCNVCNNYDKWEIRIRGNRSGKSIR